MFKKFFIYFILIFGFFNLLSCKQEQLDFTLRNIDNKKITLSDYRDKITLVSFWATWCAPCIYEIPDFVQLQNEYSDQVQILAINVDHEDISSKEWQEFKQKHRINYEILISNGKISKKFGNIYAVPTSFMIDKTGEIVKKLEGYTSFSILRDILKQSI